MSEQDREATQSTAMSSDVFLMRSSSEPMPIGIGDSVVNERVAGSYIQAGCIVAYRDGRLFPAEMDDDSGVLVGLALSSARAGEAVVIQVSFGLPQPPLSPPPFIQGSICERCYDAPASSTCHAPWGMDADVCEACAELLANGEDCDVWPNEPDDD